MRKANLKYVSQLQVMEDVDLKALGRQTDLGEGFLLGLKHRLSPDHLQARLGKETWEKLNNEGVRTVWDVALLTPERIQQISTKQNIDRLFLTRYYEDCQAFVRDLRVEASPSKRASMRAEQLATMHLAGTTS